MKKVSELKFLLSLSTDENDFQLEMEATARATATKLGVNLDVVYAKNSPNVQIQQLLKVVQSRPDAIIFQPVGSSALPQVARAAAAAGVGVVVLNWRADYIQELRKKYRVPAFIYSSDQSQIGRIQAQQIGALLPQGGQAVYIQGPSASMAAQGRLAGMMEKRPSNVQTTVLKADAWTEEAGHRAIAFWLRFSTSHSEPVDLVASQNDLIAMGARKAFGEISSEADRKRWLDLPFLGVDGLPNTGQAWVRQRLLAASIVVPPNAGLAIQTLVKEIQTGVEPPECIFTTPVSFPSVDELKRRQRY